MRKAHRLGLVLGTLCLATGCQSISGTWKTAPGQEAGPISFGSMTLANDGTFTAEAKYGAETRVMSGFYDFSGDQIVFETNSDARSYGVDLTDDTLLLSHEGSTVMMTRMRR